MNVLSIGANRLLIVALFQLQIETTIIILV